MLVEQESKDIDSYLKLKVHISILETQDKIYLLCLDIEADINGPCSKKQYDK